MIQSALVYIKKKLDQYLVNSFSLNESITVLNHLVNQDGSRPPKNQNKMVITLINLDYDTNKQYQGSQHHVAGGGITKINPAIPFNLDLLLTASFDDYEEALKFLNATIVFFHGHNSFNAKTTPDIPNGIKMLNFEIQNASHFETHNLWSAMGAKYQPSIIYKVRHVTVQSNEINAMVSALTDVNTKN
ncbi:MAG: DUF4255 domain-containing protein [Sulfuricellaceae bacterium]